MSLQIKEGGYYRTRDGRRVGPMVDCPSSEWMRDENDGFWWYNGRTNRGHDGPNDLIAEWVDEPALPVRTRTVTEIVTGQYGQVSVIAPSQAEGKVAVAIMKAGVDVGLNTSHWHMDALALRAAARVFVSLAEVLEESP